MIHVYHIVRVFAEISIPPFSIYFAILVFIIKQAIPISPSVKLYLSLFIATTISLPVTSYILPGFCGWHDPGFTCKLCLHLHIFTCRISLDNMTQQLFTASTNTTIH